MQGKERISAQVDRALRRSMFHNCPECFRGHFFAIARRSARSTGPKWSGEPRGLLWDNYARSAKIPGMESPPASATVCSVCGEPLSASGGCVPCLLRAGLDDAQEDASPPSSLVFGDFEIARRADGSLWELGRGAMGVTYRAVDKVLHRDVALKVIQTPPAADGSRAVRERFLREARAAAALRHPNVAGVFHLSASPGVDHCYFAMELVEGETLEVRVRRHGPLKVELALEIAIQVTRALMAAAARGLIHRDLKPGNIMLARGDADELEVKVIDFGLAKAAAEAAGEMDLTHGGFVGTPAFASPEQFESGAIDARSDIYALGATLWFALTGRVPFSATTIEEMRSSRTRKTLPIEQLVAKKVPPAVIKLLRSCLAIDPAERPSSARELMDSLEFCHARIRWKPRLLHPENRSNPQACCDYGADSSCGRGCLCGPPISAKEKRTGDQ